MTGLLGRLDLHSGLIQFVNAGHVAPFLIRPTGVTTLELPIDRPFGLNGEPGYRHTDVQLEPGDRVVILTDGMLERRAASLPLTDLLEQSRALNPPRQPATSPTPSWSRPVRRSPTMSPS